MKKVMLSVFVAFLAISLASCGKKEKAAETKAATETVTPAETAPAADISAEEQAFNAVLEKLDAANKCVVCHQVDVKTIGPSYKEVAKVYKEKGGNIVKFLKEEAKPIVDPAQYELMKPNLQVTKTLSGEDLAALAAYIRSFEE